MSTKINITLSELQSFLNHLSLPSETRLSIVFDDNNVSVEIMKRERAIDAIKKLKCSGNGNLTTALLKERQRCAAKVTGGATDVER